MLALLAALFGVVTLGADVSVADVGWLAGCWESADARRTIEERWTTPRGGTLLGVGRTVVGDRTVDHEFVIVRAFQGHLVYEAHPAQQTPTTFTSTDITPRRVVFENTAHDFPQQVGYELKSPTELVAWIAGTEGGKARTVTFPYRRVACDAAAAP